MKVWLFLFIILITRWRPRFTSLILNPGPSHLLSDASLRRVVPQRSPPSYKKPFLFQYWCDWTTGSGATAAEEEAIGESHRRPEEQEQEEEEVKFIMSWWALDDFWLRLKLMVRIKLVTQFLVSELWSMKISMHKMFKLFSPICNDALFDVGVTKEISWLQSSIC